MTVVALFSGSFCGGERVAQRVAEELGYPLVERELVTTAAARHNAAEERLLHAMEGPPSLLDGVRRDRPRNVAYLREAMAELVLRDDAVYHGFAVHLLPRTIAHVLKICLIANRHSRLRTAMKAQGLDEKQASKRIRDDDQKSLGWTQHLLDRGPWDERLYDEVIPMHSTSIDEAVRLIVDNAHKTVVAATPQSRSAAEDFALAARVSVALAEKGHDVDVEAADGDVTVVLKTHPLWLEKHESELKQLAQAVDGVHGVKTRLGPKARPTSVHRDLDLDVPSRILLVDDEKEFVHTLSERLEARELEAAVAYDGEDALSFVASQEPEVMVLDLKMPGIDGLEVLQRVKRDHPDVEVIILTGHGSAVEQEQAEQLGAFAYLTKPVDLGLLTRTMRKAYRKVAKKRQARDDETDDPAPESTK